MSLDFTRLNIRERRCILKSTGNTSIGLVRSKNQDYFFNTDKKIGKLNNLYIVADGMGGHKAGEIASAHTVDYFVDFIKTDKEEEIRPLLITALKMANAHVFEESRSKADFDGMGTTFVACTVLDGFLHVINVGDSRLYVYKDELEQVTLDHSRVEELFRAGLINEEERESFPNKNIITRAVGTEYNVEVDYFKLDIKGLKYVLLCSDGLTKMIENDRIAEYFIDIKDLDKTGEALIEEANNRGGIDNTTVVIVDLDSED